MTESRIDRRFAALKKEGRAGARHLRHGGRSRLQTSQEDPARPAGRRRRHHRARHAVLRSDGRRSGDPGLLAARAEGRPDHAQDAGAGARLRAQRPGHADRADGLLQSDLRLSARALPRRCARPPASTASSSSTCRPRPTTSCACRPSSAASISSASPRRPRTPSACRPCCANTSGFLYYVSITGITGTAAPDVAAVHAHVARIKKSTTLPVAVGFGVKTPRPGQSHRGRRRRRGGGLGAG